MIKRSILLLAVLLASQPANAFDLSGEVDAAARKVLPRVIEWRRYLHQNPELSNREYNTSRMVAEELKKLGLEVRTGIAKTGVVGILRSGRPGPVIGLRADMDALPVTERVDIPFRSTVTTEFNGQKVGVMHACGHDTHVAILLGAATVLSQMKDKLNGTVVFIFQPAEEGAPAGEEGGADLMVKEGVMNDPKIDAIFGLHINAQTPSGTIGFRRGGFMAASDWFIIKVHGRQSHGAYPWRSIDPIAAASQIYIGLQMIVSRQSELTRSPVVITVGRINAGIRENIIPEELTMAGTIRTLDTSVQDDVHAKIRRTVAGIAESLGATAEVEIQKRTPVTFNTPALVDKALPSLERSAGKENVREINWVTGAEDFAYYGTKAPAFFFYLGGLPVGKDPAMAGDHHTPEFYVDDSRLDVGVKAFCNLVFDYK